MIALLLAGAAVFSPFNPRILPRTTPTTSNVFLLSGAATAPPATDPAYRTPLTVLALPPYTAAGQVAGLRVDVGSWLTPTPAAGDLVGALVRVANEARLQAVPGLWALDVVALHQGGAPAGGAHVRGLEVEVGHHEPEAVQADPWAPLEAGQLRANGLEVTLQGDTPGPGTAAIMVDSAWWSPHPSARWRYGLAARGVAEAAVLDVSGARDTLRIGLDEDRPLWGLGRAGTAWRLWDYVAGHAVFAADAGRAWLWMGGAVRLVEVGPPDSAGPGWRTVRTPN